MSFVPDLLTAFITAPLPPSAPAVEPARSPFPAAVAATETDDQIYTELFNQLFTSMRGKVHDYRGTPMIVTYHPAYLLRSLPEKAKAWEDLCFAIETMRGLQSAAAAPT
mgnify:CR=1 FL=1